MPKKPQRKFKPYMSKAAVIRPAIEKAVDEWLSLHDVCHLCLVSEVAIKAAVKAMRDYDRWLQRGGD